MKYLIDGRLGITTIFLELLFIVQIYLTVCLAQTNLEYFVCGINDAVCCGCFVYVLILTIQDTLELKKTNTTEDK